MKYIVVYNAAVEVIYITLLHSSRITILTVRISKKEPPFPKEVQAKIR